MRTWEVEYTTIWAYRQTMEVRATTKKKAEQIARIILRQELRAYKQRSGIAILSVVEMDAYSSP